MNPSRFAANPTTGIRKNHEAGVSGAEPFRETGDGDTSVCKWPTGFGSIDLSEAKRPREPPPGRRQFGELEPH